MSWLSSGLKKIGGGISKVASFVPGPVGTIGSLANAAIEKKPILKSLVGDMGRNSQIAATILPIALSGGAAAGALGAGGAAGGAAGAAAGGASTASKILGGLKAIAPIGLSGLSAYEGYQNDKKAQKLSDKQLALAEASYNERQPLRTLGRDLMLNQTPPDLSYIYANSSNPFAKRGS